MMELVSEHGGVRTYRSAVGEWIEVRAMTRSRSSVIHEWKYAYPELREHVEQHNKAQLLAWFADEGEAFDRIGEPTISWEKQQRYQYLWNEDTDDLLTDEEGKHIIATDQHGHPITYFTWLCTAEQRYWPAPPSDGT